MKKTIGVVAALAFATGAFADALPQYAWFTATPGNIPADCSWNTTPTEADNAWVIDTEDGEEAVFTPKTLETGKKTRISANLAFGAAQMFEDLPTYEDDPVQAALLVGVDANDVTNFYGLVSGGWKKLSGTVPADLKVATEVTIEVDYAANPVTVAFYVGDTQLTDATDGTVKTFARFAGTTATKITSVAFSGTGKVAQIAGASDPKYVTGGAGYVDFSLAAANAGNNPVKLYANAAYTFPTTGNSALKVEANGFTFTPTFDAATYNYNSTASGVTTYTYKNTAAFGGGTGTQADPYLIANADDFAELAFFAAKDAYASFAGKYFSQTANIVATTAIPQFAGIYDGGNNALSYASGAIFTTATGATFSNLAFADALIGTASGTITASNCSMTGTVKPITTLASGATVTGLSFATLASDVYTFCGAPTAAGTYYVMLNNASAISFGAAVGDALTLTSVNSAAYTGTVSTDVAQAKVTSATVAPTTTYTIAWDTVEVTIADAEHGTVTDVAATGSGVNPVKGEGSTYTVVTGDTITVTYTASENYVYSGKDATTTVQFEASSGAAAVPPTFKLGKAKYNGELYDTVPNAVTAAAAEGEIVLVADSSDEVTIGKYVTFTGATDVAVGPVTIVANGQLTVAKGKYQQITLTPETNAKLLLKGGYYQSETNDVQAFCALGYFAEAYDGSPYITQVVPGEVIVPSGTELPVIAVEPNYFPSDVKTAEQKETYLAEEQANGKPRWVNYALDIDGTDDENQPKLADAGDADTVVVDLANGQLKQGTGLTAELQVKDGDSWTETDGVIELNDSIAAPETGTMRLVLKDTASKVTDVTEVGYGLKAQAPASALEIISVPFTELGDSTAGLPLSKVLKLKNLAAGDKIYRYNATEGKNEGWTLSNEGTWVGASGTDPAVKPGEGLWLERQDNTGKIFFFGGYSANVNKKSPVAANQWGLVANPNLVESLSLDDIIAEQTDCKVTLEMADGPKVCTHNGTDWGYTTISNEVRTVKGKQVTIQRSYRTTAPAIAPGQGFWVNNAGTENAELNWNPDKK